MTLVVDVIEAKKKKIEILKFQNIKCKQIMEKNERSTSPTAMNDISERNFSTPSAEVTESNPAIDEEKTIPCSNGFEIPPKASNVNADDLDQETTSKLRGDSIGDTLYSQSFVLKTLLEFSDLNWNEQLEEDLCFLWDMTAEKSVCEYLWEVSFPSIACSAVSNYTENRFIEIVIGTLANVLCAGCDKTMTTEEISIIIEELQSNDHLILIQLMRFITALAFSSKDTPFINEEVMERLCFVLNNSSNSELLLKTLETTAKLTDEYKLSEKLVNLELYNAGLTSYCTLLGSETDYFELDTKESLLACRYMLETITNICGYIDHFENNKLRSEISESSDVFLKEAMKIIKFFSQEQNLLPVTDDIVFFMSAFQYIFVCLNIKYVPELFIMLANILCIISEIRNDVGELFEATAELECFLISRGTKGRILKDLKLLSKHKMKTVLGIVAENGPKYTFGFDWKCLSDVPIK